MGDPPAPLSLRQRIAQLEHAAASPLLAASPSSSTTTTTGPSRLGPTSTPSALPPPAAVHPVPRAPSPQVLARYIQPSTGPASPSTSSLNARGERPTSPTQARTAPARPHFAQGFRAAAPSPTSQDAETALSAHLSASPVRSRAGSVAGETAPGVAPTRPAEVKQRPTPPSRPSSAAWTASKATGDAAPSPPLPPRSSTLAPSAALAAPAPLLPPRRASTLSASPSPTSSAPSPPLPPRPRAVTAAATPSSGAASLAPRAGPPPPPPGGPRTTASSSSSSSSRPVLAAKPTTHDPLSLASPRPKPYAAPSGSPSASTSRTSLASTLSPSSSSLSRSQSQAQGGPAWAPRSKPPTPLSSLPTRPVDPSARARYGRVFARLGRAEVQGGAGGGGGGSGPGAGAGKDKGESVEGAVVAGLWRRSGLPEGELRRIWEEVAAGRGALDEETFARGMWAIDEALRVRKERHGVRV